MAYLPTQLTTNKRCSSATSSSKVHSSNAERAKNTETNWREEIRSRLKEKTPKKKVYGYIKDMQAMDDMGEERGTIKNIFFSAIPKDGPNTRQNFTNTVLRVTKQSLVPTRVSRNDPFIGHIKSMSVKPKTSLAVSKPDGKKSLMKQLNISALDNAAKRMTLMQIRQKATILKNVHDNPTEDEASPNEQAIFKKITLMLETHLTDEDNLFRVLFQEFQVYFITKYEQKVQDVLKIMRARQLSVDEESDLVSTCEVLCNEVIEFIQVMVKCLILFYNFDICYFRVDGPELSYLPCTVLNFDNLMNFAAAIMFPKRVYQLVLEYFKCRSKEQDDKLFTNMNKYQTIITMDTLEVTEKFQLKRANDQSKNESVKHGFTGYPCLHVVHENATRESTKDEKLIYGYEDRMTPRFDEKSKVKASVTVSRSGTVSDDLGYIDDPYHEAIRTLRYINEVESPLEKMKVLLLTVRKIIKAINEFYKGSKEKQEVLMGDQIMSLVVYVVLKSRCPNLIANIDYVETFLPSRMFSTFTGYYLTVFHAACEYIVGFNSSDDIGVDTSNTV